MGVIKQGILGGFSGKVGNVIGATWNGIDYMRIMPANVENPKTEAQLDQRSKFATTLFFLQPFTVFLRTGFRRYAKEMTEFNAAMSYNIKNAITGSYPSYSVDLSNALISRGKLAGALNPDAVSSTPGTVTFTWDDNSVYGNAHTTDKSMLVVYNPDKKDAIFVIDGADRSTGTDDLTIPTEYMSDTLHAFIAFIREDGRRVSNSTYIGTVSII